MGSIPYADALGTGVTFRVWAPDATSVNVPGTFNGWNTTANPLVKEGSSGLWSGDISTARANAQYKYLINGSVWKQDPRSRKVVNSADNSIVYDPNGFNWSGDTRLTVTNSNLVIYEMHVGAFYDPTPSSGGPGKFTDAITKLDYLASLGINAVELLPIAEFPGDYGWGYSPSDPYAVENTGYGGPDGLKSFVKGAHQRGIRVILDVVHNHYGPSDLDLWGFDVGTTPGIYFYSGSGICCTPWGSRPNYASEGVRSYIIDNFRMWMDECHVDGFRWDAVGAMRHYDPGYVSIPEADSLIQYINSVTIHSDHPGTISIAEDNSAGMNFDGEWGVGFGDEVINEMVQTVDNNRDMNALKGTMDGNGFGRVLYTETHDLVGALNGSGAQRLPVRIQAANPTSYFARKRSMLAAAIIMTSPGIPMIFMGQEMLTTNQFADNMPLDWTRVNTYSNVWSFYHDLIRLRRNLDGLSWGLTGPNVSWHTVDNTAKLLAFHRWGAGPNDQVMVVMNCANTQINNYQINQFPVDGTWFVDLNSDWKTYGADFGNVGSSMVQVSSGSGKVTIAPYSVLILSVSSPPKFTNIQTANGNVSLSWTGPPSPQVIEQAADLNGPWTPVFTNQPPAPTTNSISISGSGASSQFFRIRIAP
jgi:1,4-alpha-glucan branching enzyme